MNLNLFLLVFFALGIIYFLIGISSSQNMKTKTDFFLAGKKLGFFQVMFGLIATHLGGSLLMGTSSEAYKYGFYGLLYTFGMSLGFLLLGSGIASKLKAINVSTTAEILEKKYNSKTLKKIGSLFLTASMFGLLIGQIVVSKAFLEGLGLLNNVTFLAFWFLIIAYAIKGGLKAIVSSHIFQVSFIIIIFMGIFLYYFLPNPEGFFQSSILAHKEGLFDISEFNYFRLLQIFLMPAMFAIIEQDLAQQLFAAKTKRIALLASLSASLFLILFAMAPIFLGITAKILNPGGIEPDSALVVALSQLTNQFVFILAICGIIAAVSSTASSLLCAASSHISHDFDIPLFKNKGNLFIPKLITLVIGLLAIILSYFIHKGILDVITESYKLSISGLFIPIIFALFSKNLKKKAAILSISFGFTSYLILKMFPVIFLPDGISAVIFSLIGYLIGMLI